MLLHKALKGQRAPIVPIILLKIFLDLGLKFPLKMVSNRLEDAYEESSLEEDNDNVPVDNGPPVDENPPVDFGYDDDYIGDSNFTLYTRRDVYLLKAWRVFLLELGECAGFLVSEPPIAERLNLMLRAMNRVNWQRAISKGSGEAIIESLPAAITGFSMAAPQERWEFLGLFAV